MRAEFFRPESPDQVVAEATWEGGRVRVHAGEPEVAATLRRIVRPVAVLAEDPSLEPPGAAGPVVLPPGSLSWFQAAARTRAGAEGLRVRFVPSGDGAIGWDPAGAYRPFPEAVVRMERAESSPPAP